MPRKEQSFAQICPEGLLYEDACCISSVTLIHPHRSRSPACRARKTPHTGSCRPCARCRRDTYASLPTASERALDRPSWTLREPGAASGGSSSRWRMLRREAWRSYTDRCSFGTALRSRWAVLMLPDRSMGRLLIPRPRTVAAWMRMRKEAILTILQSSKRDEGVSRPPG